MLDNSYCIHSMQFLIKNFHHAGSTFLIYHIQSSPPPKIIPISTEKFNIKQILKLG